MTRNAFGAQGGQHERQFVLPFGGALASLGFARRVHSLQRQATRQLLKQIAVTEAVCVGSNSFSTIRQRLARSGSENRRTGIAAPKAAGSGNRIPDRVDLLRSRR
jgi:hypothetical protein